MTSNKKNNIELDFIKRSISQLLKYGVVNVDKYKGPTSHQIADTVKKILHINKTGHSGSLDPAVTGCLPVALGRATKLAGLMLKSPKEYICIMHVHNDFHDNKLKKVFKDFTGEIKQMPPVRSAVKRRKRKRTIYELELLERKDNDVLFRVLCEAGTYIRKLAHDMGKAIGPGAHMQELRRTKAGVFREDSIVTLPELNDAYCELTEKGDETLIRKFILPMECMIKDIPKIILHDNAIIPIMNGRPLAVPGIIKADDFEKDQKVALITSKNQLIALGKALVSFSEYIKRKEKKGKGLVVKIERVITDKEDL